VVEKFCAQNFHYYHWKSFWRQKKNRRTKIFQTNMNATLTHLSRFPCDIFCVNYNTIQEAESDTAMGKRIGNVFIKSLNGKNITLRDLDFSSATVKTVMEQIHEREGIAVDIQRLMCQGRNLPRDSAGSLHDLGVSPDSNIYLHLALRGGMFHESTTTFSTTANVDDAAMATATPTPTPTPSIHVPRHGMHPTVSTGSKVSVLAPRMTIPVTITTVASEDDDMSSVQLIQEINFEILPGLTTMADLRGMIARRIGLAPARCASMQFTIDGIVNTTGRLTCVTTIVDLEDEDCTPVPHGVCKIEFF
jgi:hypothetical protein